MKALYRGEEIKEKFGESLFLFPVGIYGRGFAGQAGFMSDFVRHKLLLLCNEEQFGLGRTLHTFEKTTKT